MERLHPGNISSLVSAAGTSFLVERSRAKPELKPHIRLKGYNHEFGTAAIANRWPRVTTTEANDEL
jgi:hypothetical protein